MLEGGLVLVGAFDTNPLGVGTLVGWLEGGSGVGGSEGGGVGGDTGKSGLRAMAPPRSS